MKQAPRASVCPFCGWTEEKILATDRLGCPLCYTVFESIAQKYARKSAGEA